MAGRNRNLASRTDRITHRLGILVAVFLSLGITALPAAPQSHMGQKVSDHVTLRIVRINQGPCDGLPTRILPNGSEVVGFDLAGRWLVVTDVTWRTAVGPGFPIGHQLGLLRLTFFLGANGRFFESSVLVTEENISDPIFKSEHLTTGFVVSAIPCFEWEQIGSDDGGVSGLVILHGYLIDRPGGR